MTIKEKDFTRINNDTYGNPRYVLHYLAISNNYDEAVKIGNSIGGRKYNTKSYGGGIVFQSYNIRNEANKLNEIIRKAKRKNRAQKTKELNKHVFKYIIACIDSEPYEVETNTPQEKLNFLMNTFKKEYGHEIQRQGNEQKALASWIMGLPTVYNVDFENYKILEIAREWGSLADNATEAQENKIIREWFIFIAAKTLVLHRALNGKNSVKVELED